MSHVVLEGREQQALGHEERCHKGGGLLDGVVDLLEEESSKGLCLQVSPR